jgi:hypothetical protein
MKLGTLMSLVFHVCATVLNVPVDAVLHPASVSAQQVAKDRARVALEEAAIEEGDQRSVPTVAPDQLLGELPAKFAAADILPLASAGVVARDV